MEKYCPKCFKKYPMEVEVCPGDGSFLVSPHEKDLTGEVLDNRYTVLERIGRGGMGVVYRAEQHLIKRIVALKVLRREVVQDETAVKRFLTEAQAIASLDSRHTVTLYDFGVTRDGLLYYTMELLKGHPLSWIIRKEAPLEIGRAARLVIQVCDSLKEAHDRGILHRDLKPDNLFVVERDEREMIKVVDFGIAKLVGDSSVESVTRTGMIVGTPQYLSPEQALGNPVVPASDLYSMAIVFYEMLAGVPPFQDETPMKTLWCHVRDPLPPLSSKNPSVQVPRSIEAFLARALEKEAGRRFPTAVAFRDALRKALEDHDAAPETVSLPNLSTTDEGLRLKTQAWNRENVVAGAARPRRSGLEENPEDRGTAVLRPEPSGRPSPPAGPSLGDAQPKDQAPAHPGATAAGRPRGEPSPVPPAKEKASLHAVVAPSAPPIPRRLPAPVSMEGKISAATGETEFSGPGPETKALLLAGRPRFLWAVGAAAAAVILVAMLAVWRPWDGGGADDLEAKRETQAAVVAPPAAQKTEEDPRMGEETKKQVKDEEVVVAVVGAVATAGKQAEEAGKAEETAKYEEARKAAEVHKLAEDTSGTPKVEEAEAARMLPQETAKAEEARKAGDMERAKETRRAEEDRKAEQARQAQVAAKAEEDKKAEQTRQAEEAAKAKESAKAAEVVRKKAEDEQRRAAGVAKEKAEQAKKAEEERKAEETRKKAEERKTSNIERGRKEMQAGRYEQAIALLGEAKKDGAEPGEVDGLIRECYDRIGKREVKSLVGRGNNAFDEKRWDDCVKYFDAAVKLGGSTPDVDQKLKKCRAMTTF